MMAFLFTKERTMEEAKYTKGPWDNGASITLRATDTDIFGYSISYINTPHEGRKQEALANARLISAAPDLLEALQEAMQALEWCVEQGGGPVCEHESGVVCFCKENDAINAARAAISKALGK